MSTNPAAGRASATPENPALHVRTATPDDRLHWDGFVKRHPRATFFHQWAWHDVVRATYRFPPAPLVALRGEQVVGVLPLHYVRVAGAGRALVSSPCAVYGGPLADDDAAQAVLISAVESLAANNRCRRIELRGQPVWSAEHRLPPPAGWLQQQQYTTFATTLPADRDALLKSIPRKQRAVIRKAQNSPLTLQSHRDLDRFYRLYQRSVHRLGSPAFPLRHLTAIAAAFPDAFSIDTMAGGGRDLASVFTLHFGDIVSPYYAGSVVAARARHAFPLLYYQLMCRSIDEDRRRFDFGRSIAGSSSEAFKRNLGFVAQPLPYAFKLPVTESAPQRHPDEGLFRYITAIWRATPAPIVDRLGPYLARWIA